ncbi:VWA domain-containing protein [Caenimonas koreensis DSM 17982]|uniref:VWA domain-containing protein n=1 Tax=Caenimonas koreensis DSM 17982 TaxID=1121255 RepID=A0A844AZK0_9BURK|nr:VWA domain-containing protein [Caenimonas koreensis]MRD46482.1 VWA domain-containing protein [Caenimonas koreensis DSM 17982]
MQLGDSRTGKLADNIAGFGRALRRAGVRMDSARIALAQDAAQLVGVDERFDFGAALESVMVSREQDRDIFRELFDVYFRNPDIAAKLLAQMLPSAEARAEPTKRRPRVSEALLPQKAFGQKDRKQEEEKIDLDAAMTASDANVLRHADFNALSSKEYALVERLAREVALPIPMIASRRTRPGVRGASLHWGNTLRHAARTGGELMELRKLTQREEDLPLLVLVDVSGSMERYARLLLAFLHAATRTHKRRNVFAFGTHLTDLSHAFRIADTDAMLAAASAAIDDFAGGTRLGESLATLRQTHERKLVGRRTLVLIISDGLDTGEPAGLDSELQWLGRHSRKLLWLNPLLRFDGYAPLAQGAAVLHRHADAMIAVHNLSKLEDLAARLVDVMKAGRRP